MPYVTGMNCHGLQDMAHNRQRRKLAIAVLLIASIGGVVVTWEALTNAAVVIFGSFTSSYYRQILVGTAKDVAVPVLILAGCCVAVAATYWKWMNKDEDDQ